MRAAIQFVAFCIAGTRSSGGRNSTASIIRLRFCCFLFASAISLLPLEARGDLILTGAQIYAAGDNADGSIRTESDVGYRFTTNLTDTGGASLSINGDPSKAISIPLAFGDNLFTFAGTASVDPGTFVGLNLFFTDTDGTPDNSFNPDSPFPIAGDLTVFTQVGSAANAFATVSSGLSIQNYGTSGWGQAIANGNSSFLLGDQLVSVTSFSSDSYPSGSFTLTVSAVPEPSSLGLVAASGMALMAIRRRSFASNTANH